MGCVALACKSCGTTMYEPYDMAPEALEIRRTKKFVSAVRKTAFIEKDYDPRLHNPNFLTSEQKQLVKETWNTYSNAPIMFQNAFLSMIRSFVLSPEVLAIFKTESSSQLSGTVIFQRPAFSSQVNTLKTAMSRPHLKSFINFIGQEVVNKMDKEDVLRNIITLGKKHHGYNAHPCLLKALCEGFLFSIEKSLFPDVDAELIKAWETLMLKVAYFWDQGYWTSVGQEMAKYEIPVKPNEVSIFVSTGLKGFLKINDLKLNSSTVDHKEKSPEDSTLQNVDSSFRGKFLQQNLLDKSLAVMTQASTMHANDGSCVDLATATAMTMTSPFLGVLAPQTPPK